MWRSIVWVKSVVLFKLRDLHLDLISKTMDLVAIVVKFSFLPLAKRGKKACSHKVELSFVLIFRFWVVEVKPVRELGSK